MSEQIKEIGLTPEQANALREECKKTIEIANALARLEQNADYKKVFLEEYLHDEPARLVNLLGETQWNMSDKKDMFRFNLQEQMIGIARFSEFIRMVYMKAEQAKKNLDDLASAERM